jgi:hypothetical protein
MSVLGWDEPYPHDVVRLRVTGHTAKRRVHLCAECFKDIQIGEQYICQVYVDDGKIGQYKVHAACPYSFGVLEWIKGIFRRGP